MSTPKGYSSQEKEDRLSAQFSTVEPIREQQFGLSVNAHQYVYSAASDAAEAGSTAKVIIATGHAAKKGDILFFYSGSLGNVEVKVWDVSVNAIELAETLPAAPIVGDIFDVLRHKYPVVNSDGTPILTLTEQAIGNNAVAPSTDEVKMMGGFDGTDARYVKTDTDGELQIDVLSSALPAGAATEATLATLATEATVSTLATEATVSTLATAAAQTDGSQKTQIVDGSGNVIGSTGNALDVNLKTPVTVDVSLSQANDSVAVFGSDGAVNRALKTDANGELQIDVLSSALPTGAATEATLGTVSTNVATLAGAVAAGLVKVDLEKTAGSISAGNSSSVALGSNASFVGAWEETTNFASVAVGVYSDQSSATDGFKIEFSTDGISVHHTHTYSYLSSSAGTGYLFQPEFRYYRINYTNGAVAQASFSLISIVRQVPLFPSQYRVSQAVTGESQALVTKGVIYGQTTGGGGGYVAVKVNPSGALTVDASVSSSVLPTGAATEATLSALNGKVTTCNTGAVTISTALPAGTNTIGKVDVNTLSPVDFARLDYTVTSVTTGAYVQLKASLAAAVKEVEIFDSSGQTLLFAVGAAASEVDKFYIIPGGNGRFPITIPAGSRVALKAVSATANTGEIDVNFLG